MGTYSFIPGQNFLSITNNKPESYAITYRVPIFTDSPVIANNAISPTPTWLSKFKYNIIPSHTVIPLIKVQKSFFRNISY